MTRHGQQAFTLPELLVSLAVSAILLTALASAMVIASRAIPDGANPQMQAVNAFQVVEQLNTELATATSFSLLGANAIEFTVPDRVSDVDVSPEVIRYEWSGTNGESLVRTYNGDPVKILDDLNAFSLVYGTHSEVTTTTEMVETTGNEGIVAYFDGWTGLTPTSQEKYISNTNWVWQLLYVTPPVGVTKIKFTRARVWMRRDLLTVLGTFKIQLYRPTTVGGIRSSASPLVTAPSISGIGLPLTAFWATAYFDNMPVTDLTRSDYHLKVEGTLSDGVWLSHYQHSSAPSNNTIMYWTSNGGGSNSPSSNFDRQDMRFYLYASYISNTEQQVEATIKKLDMVRITLQAGSQAGARIDTEVAIYNQPNVTGL